MADTMFRAAPRTSLHDHPELDQTVAQWPQRQRVPLLRLQYCADSKVSTPKSLIETPSTSRLSPSMTLASPLIPGGSSGPLPSAGA